MSWVVIVCHHLWGGEEDVWLGSGRVHISMGAMGSVTSWLLQSRARMHMCV